MTFFSLSHIINEKNPQSKHAGLVEKSDALNKRDIKVF